MGRQRSGEEQQLTSAFARRAGVLLAALALTAALGSATAQASAAMAASSSYSVPRACRVPPPGAAACTAVRLASVARAASPFASPAAAQFLTPQALHTAYSLPVQTPYSSTQTVAVIDAFDDPTAEADLGVYDETYGLPACTSAN